MKNNYTVTKSEVRTTYSIQIPIGSTMNILKKAQVSKLADIYWKTSLIDLKTVSQVPIIDLENNFAKLWNVCHGAEDTETIRFIVQLLGFDGVENYGIYDEEDECIKMSVYKYGDQIN